MKFFVFNLNSKEEIFTEDNGWLFELKFKKKLGCFSLTSPTMKEITHSKGTTVRYTKHTVCGIGYIKDNLEFKGVAFFDVCIRMLFILAISVGVGYVSGTLNIGVFWAFLFYLLVSFLSSTDDDSILHRAKRICEM